MWRQVEVDGHNWFLQTTIATDDDKLEVLVFNPTDVLCEKVEFNHFFTRVKQLNKRIQYKEDIVRAALKDEQPTEATLTPSDNQCAMLKLKYRIGGRPLFIEWRLNKQTSTELIRTLVMPLLKGIHDLWTQNGVLRSAVVKKDEEIKQYRFEHGDLRRKTIATKIFDFDSFDLEHKNTNSWCDQIQGIGASLATFHAKASASADNCVNEEKPADSANALNNANAPAVNKCAIKCEEDEKPACSTTNVLVTSKTKVSPRNRKRQFKAQYEEVTARNLRTKKKRLEYHNSQTSSDGSEDLKALAHHEQTSNGTPVVEIEHDDFKIDTCIDRPSANTISKSKPPPTELSAEVDSILRELEELEQRRLSDLQQHTHK